MKIVDLFESEFLTDKDEIIEYMNESFLKFDPSKLRFDSDGLVYDEYLVSRITMTEIAVQFKSVAGYFDCNSSKIISLEGCPKSVRGYFNCENTNITSLKYCPTSIRTRFYCTNIKIVDPKEYRFALYCEIGEGFHSSDAEINDIINTYYGSDNRKHWPHAINLLSKVRL